MQFLLKVIVDSWVIFDPVIDLEGGFLELLEVNHINVRLFYFANEGCLSKISFTL